MVISKTIPKPRNWQDFERLCKKIFGELWGCPNSIKANGRSGQPQQGVDIYGIPKGEAAYWGVQCKGKDDYLSTAVTADEVDAEISKARRFQPALGAFFLVTTASKDVKLEEHVRKRDIESREKGGFAIHIMCWEDLADQIEESRATYNWWVREKRHREEFDLSVTFADGGTESRIAPRLHRVTKKYAITPLSPWLARAQAAPTSLLAGLLSGEITDPAQEIAATLGCPPRRKNLSWCDLNFTIANTGQEVIEDYKLDFSLEGAVDRLSHRDDPNLSVGDGWFAYCPRTERPLTQEERRSFTLGIKPTAEQSTIAIRWKLFARDFTKEGVLTVVSSPEIECLDRTITVQTPEEVRTEVVFEDVMASSSEEPLR